MPKPPCKYFPNDALLPFIHFPHMQKVEREMFRLWLVSKGQGFRGFMFDVRVGEGQLLISSDGEQYTRMWYELTKKRIDALGFKDNETWLIEIKRKLNLMVIGQMDLYTSLLWQTAFPDGPRLSVPVSACGLWPPNT